MERVIEINLSLSLFLSFAKKTKNISHRWRFFVRIDSLGAILNDDAVRRILSKWKGLERSCPVRIPMKTIGSL